MGILDECINVAADPGPWSAMIYGAWGAGKSVLGAGVTDPLYIEIGKEKRSLLNHPELAYMYDRVIKCDSTATFEDIIKKSKGDPDIQTNVVDTISRLQIKDVMWFHKNKAYSKDPYLPSQAEFNASNRRIGRIIDNIVETHDKNLLLLCHDKEEKDNDGLTTLIRPGTSEALTNRLAQAVDAVFYLDAKRDSKGNITSRKLITVATTKLKAKNRFGNLPAEIILKDNERNILFLEQAAEEQRQKALQLQKELINNA